eukprot:gnl/TRDRNA2_/TRDRNA2_176434_c4_seq4.p1 gnl/TRDRNA2_/TRDRNA2_176434_c4~~gnl/TRDRNA2_/TRDRNA2_176434_c4_seq4.p1  ORF type:complete len:178 (-),score=8.96 gnl/TRDRNA2_/TRDRNA2_176434_c4_seq4:41-574(-)
MCFGSCGRSPGWCSMCFVTKLTAACPPRPSRHMRLELTARCIVLGMPLLSLHAAKLVERGPHIRCPNAVQPGDDSASCKAYCKEQGYSSGQMAGKGNRMCGSDSQTISSDPHHVHCACRCRKILPTHDRCPIDDSNDHIEESRRQVSTPDHAICYFDVCSVNNPWNKDLLREPASEL